MTLTVFIGTGISSAAYLLSVKQYLASMDQTLGHVHVLGGADLWHKMKHDHAMGQPRQLLTGNLLGHGREDRGFTNHQLLPGTFMSAGQFATVIQYYLRTHSSVQIPDSHVSRITREGSQYLVEVHLAGQPSSVVRCDRVIISPGPGAPRPLTTTRDGSLSEEQILGFGGQVIKGNDFMAPDWKNPLRTKNEDTTIAVYGGSATAAWVVELAAMRGMNVVCWFTRPGRDKGAWDAETRFDEAFPAGDRNNAVKADYKNVRKVLKLISIEKVEDSTNLRLTFQQSDGKFDVLHVGLLVYALGAEHSLTQGVIEILTPDITANLVAFYDRNMAISSKPSLLAIGMADRSLMIVGSAMSSSAGFGESTLAIQGGATSTLATIRDLTSYKEISSTLPAAARPTEGIAMVMAGIEALNEYMPVRVASQRVLVMHSTPALTTAIDKKLPKGSPNPDAGHDRLHDINFEWDINFNTSNRTQIATYIADTTDLPPFPANLAVALIVYLRSCAGNVLGLSDAQVSLIIRVSEYYAKELIRLNPHINDHTARLNYDKLWGPDKYLDECIRYATTPVEWKQFWNNNGIACEKK